MEDSSEPTRQRPGLSTRRKLLFVAVLATFVLVFFETSTRVVYFVMEGFNPFYLTFGFVPDVQWHSDEYDGYTKFQPNSTYHQKIHGGVIDMAINSDGFRGMRDFERPKPTDVFRIVAMGASSTFGYYDHDEETYPYFLEQRLSQAYPDRRIEVLNLGIPHYRLVNVLALARAELASLEPDVVVLYAGYNNAMIHEDPEKGHLLFRIKSWLNFHSVGWRAVKPLVLNAYYLLVESLNRDIGQLPNLHVPVRLDEPAVTALRERVRARFGDQLREFADVVEDAGAVLVPMTQTYTLQGLGNDMSLSKVLDSYAKEVAHVESALAEEGAIPAPHSTLLIHRDFMNEFRGLAKERGLPVIEGIRAIDGHRQEMLASYVHLTGDGNARLADEMLRSFEQFGLLGN